MKALQSLHPSSSTTPGFLPKETISEIEKMKASAQTTTDWLKDVHARGDSAIKDILSVGKDAVQAKELLEHVLSQDKEDIDLLLQKSRVIIEYGKDQLVTDGILSSSRLNEPWEWFEALQIWQKVMKKIQKRKKQMDGDLTRVYEGCITFFEVMTGRRKIAPKYLSLEQLKEWWHNVYAPDSENVITGHQLDDAATYLAVNG